MCGSSRPGQAIALRVHTGQITDRMGVPPFVGHLSDQIPESRSMPSIGRSHSCFMCASHVGTPERFDSCLRSLLPMTDLMVMGYIKGRVVDAHDNRPRRIGSSTTTRRDRIL